MHTLARLPMLLQAYTTNLRFTTGQGRLSLLFNNYAYGHFHAEI